VREIAGAGKFYEALMWVHRRLANARCLVDGIGCVATPVVDASAVDIHASPATRGRDRAQQFRRPALDDGVGKS
jgi:hypothetical protein